MKGLFKSFALGAMVILGASISFQGMAQAERPIKIGSFLATTGPASFLGDPELKTLQMYVEEINSTGGILGHPLELVWYDTAGKAKAATDIVKKLVKKDRVDVIVGGSTSGTTLSLIHI